MEPSRRMNRRDGFSYGAAARSGSGIGQRQPCSPKGRKKEGTPSARGAMVHICQKKQTPSGVT